MYRDNLLNPENDKYDQDSGDLTGSPPDAKRVAALNRDTAGPSPQVSRPLEACTGWFKRMAVSIAMAAGRRRPSRLRHHDSRVCEMQSSSRQEAGAAGGGSRRTRWREMGVGISMRRRRRWRKSKPVQASPTSEIGLRSPNVGRFVGFLIGLVIGLEICPINS